MLSKLVLKLLSFYSIPHFFVDALWDKVSTVDLSYIQPIPFFAHLHVRFHNRKAFCDKSGEMKFIN